MKYALHTIAFLTTLGLTAVTDAQPSPAALSKAREVVREGDVQQRGGVLVLSVLMADNLPATTDYRLICPDRETSRILAVAASARGAVRVKGVVYTDAHTGLRYLVVAGKVEPVTYSIHDTPRERRK